MILEIHIPHRIIFPINPLKFPWAEDKHGHLRSKGRGWPPPTATAQGFLGLKILPSTKWCRVLSIHSMFVRVCQDPEVTRNSCTSEKGLVPQLISPLIMHFCTPIKCNKSSYFWYQWQYWCEWHTRVASIHLACPVGSLSAGLKMPKDFRKDVGRISQKDLVDKYSCQGVKLPGRSWFSPRKMATCFWVPNFRVENSGCSSNHGLCIRCFTTGDFS